LRQAKFHSTLALAIPNEQIQLFSGNLNGLITKTPRGANGFGYCPIFLLPGINKTYAELTLEEQAFYSHRSIACKKLLDYLEKIPLNNELK
jgi:XTP/dITP diphosphohydrolase